MSGNVGYLALTSVQPPKFAADLFTNAMGFLARTDALILDLRANGGGDAVLPEFILSYFFDEAVLIGEVEQRGVAKPGQAWTYGHVPGHRYGSTRPLFVLTSDSTFSGAEAIAYALQTAKRAVIIGGRTGGGANAGDFLAIGNGLTLFVPSARLVNPVTHTNWDGVGVAPDIEVRSADALRVAHDSALARLSSRR
jgi:C-terminal processing protease CtpA/Prc